MTTEEKYKIFDRMQEGIQIISIDGKYIYANDAIARQGKSTKEKLIGSSILHQYPGFENTDLFKKIRACHTTGKADELVNEFDFPDGTKGYSLLRLEPLEEGVLIRSYDITDLKKAELNIKISNKQLEEIIELRTREIQEQKKVIENNLQEILKLSDCFQAILDNTTDSIVLINPGHKIVCFNNEIKKALSYYFKKEPCVGDDYRDFVVEANKELYLNSFNAAIRGETILVENETIENDVAIWFQYKVNPVYDNKKEILGVTLTATNIDARKKKEIALQQSEETIRRQAETISASERYYRTLIETSSDAIVLMDAEGKVLYQTPSTERITGYTLAEIQNMEGINLIHPDDREHANLYYAELITSPNKVINLKLRLKPKDRDYLWLEGTYRNLLHDENVKAIVLNYTDISDRVFAEQNIVKYNRELRLLNTINDLILRCEEELNLYTEVCRCIVQSGGYKLAWICHRPAHDMPDQSVHPLVAFGETNYLKEINISFNDKYLTDDPTTIVLLTGKTVLSNNIMGPDTFKSWRKIAGKYGIAASLVLPLNFKNGKRGALEIYSEHADAFDANEILILERIASNLSLAIQNIRNTEEKEKAKYLLQERIKELTTIYKVNEILQNVHWEVSKVFTEIVSLLPAGWQYPQVCAAQICFDGECYRSAYYTPSQYKQHADFILHDGRVGYIEVLYTRQMPDNEEGPFLKEERELINSIAETIQVYFNKASQQRALITSEAKFRGAFEHAAIGMAIVSLQGEWMMINHAICDMLGYTEEEMLKLTFQEITHPDDLGKDLEFLQKTINGEIDYYRMEKRYFCKDGKTIWINLNVSLIRDVHKNPLYFVSQVENINARKNMEMERQRIIHDLANRNHDLEQFSDILSHNVQGPVSTLLGLSTMIRDEKDEDDRNYILGAIESSVKQLDSIIKELNEILYVKNSLSDVKSRVDLNNLTQEVTTMMESAICEKNAIIKFDFTTLPEITGVSSYLKNIFYNLIANGIQYAHPSRQPEMHISSKIADGRYHLIFSDNGIGIDLEKHGEQMFGLHKRFHSIKQGRGLGLYMVKTQVNAMNGTIEVHSTPGEGSTFTVIFEE